MFRSCFIEWPTMRQATTTIADLHDLAMDGLVVGHQVNSIFHHEADAHGPEYFSVHFALRLDDTTPIGAEAEQHFIGVCALAGGEYTGS